MEAAILDGDGTAGGRFYMEDDSTLAAAEDSPPIVFLKRFLSGPLADALGSV